MITRIRDWNKKEANGDFSTKDVEHDDLLPCPFCGGGARVEVSGSAWHVRCVHCFAKSAYHDLPPKWNSKKDLDTHLIRKAVADWNKRFTPTASTAKVIAPKGTVIDDEGVVIKGSWTRKNGGHGDFWWRFDADDVSSDDD